MSTRVSLPFLQSLASAVRRRVWRTLFAPAQERLGTFFLDPRDHIGKERLVTGDRYEAVGLHALEQLVTVLGLRPGMALDGGANIGNHACWFATRFAHVLCVEPGRVASLVLEANLIASGSTNWQIARCALGDREGSGSLEIVDQMNLGSSRVVPSQGETASFLIRTGDELLAMHQPPNLPLTLIKLDIEGAELVALTGLKGTLTKSQPLLCVEVLDADRWAPIQALLASVGYDTFLALTPKWPTRGRLSHLLTVLRGRRWNLTAIPNPFPAGGYEMVFCLTRQHAAKLDEWCATHGRRP